jgi:hypothetical protein
MILMMRKSPMVQKRGMNVWIKKAIRMSKVTNSNRLLGLHKDMKLKKQMKMMGLSRIQNDQRAEDDGAQQNKNDQGDEKGQ